MKVLVLGSAGQVGAYLCDHLRASGHEVYEYDIANSIMQDLRIPSDELNNYIKYSDFVFFLAFDVGGSRYLSQYQNTYEFMNNNTKIMQNVFSYLHKHSKPFIFASSQMSNMSYSPYGVAKAVGESFTRSLDGVVVKFWNVYGVEHDLDKAHVITDFILKANETGIINMMTDGQEEREFLYAEDCCLALETIMNNYEIMLNEKELCITSFQSTKIIDIAIIIAEHFNAKVVPSERKDSVQMNKKNIANSSILKYWQPKTNLQDGIEKIINEMKFQGVL